MPLDLTAPVIVEVPPEQRTIYEQRLMHGRHEQTDFDGKRRMYKPGELVKSHSNLHQRWPERFAPPERSYLGGHEMPVDSGQVSVNLDPSKIVASPPVDPLAANKAILSDLSLEELRKLAAEEEVQFTNKTSKAELINILAAVPAKAK